MTPDSTPTHWSHRLPPGLRPCAQLSRLDRPVGYWLLALPGWIGIAFAGILEPLGWAELWLGALILIGAIAMRGAGCTYNDIVDADLDAQVARTRSRPLPSGRVSRRGAWMWVLAQCAVGLIVLLMLPNHLSQIVALASLPLVAAYPFMKRIWGFPQIWLGLTFNWAVLVAYAAVTGSLGWPVLLLYGGLAFWTLGYDTIYALQDIEDDAMVGIKSSAISFGRGVRWGVCLSYGVSSALIIIAMTLEVLSPLYDVMYFGSASITSFWLRAISKLAFVALPFVLHLVWQTIRLKPDNPKSALALFKSNVWAGALLFLSLLAWAIYTSLTL